VSPTSKSALANDAPAGLETRDTADLEVCATSELWTADRLAQILDAYHAEHDRLSLDPDARNIRHTYVTPSEDKKIWRVQQMLVDPEKHNDWVAEFGVDLAQSRANGEPVLRLLRIGSLSDH
jgi:hypothetical protein